MLAIRKLIMKAVLLGLGLVAALTGLPGGEPIGAHDVGHPERTGEPQGGRDGDAPGQQPVSQ